jgi:hypothetical protein
MNDALLTSRAGAAIDSEATASAKRRIESRRSHGIPS